MTRIIPDVSFFASNGAKHSASPICTAVDGGHHGAGCVLICALFLLGIIHNAKVSVVVH